MLNDELYELFGIQCQTEKIKLKNLPLYMAQGRNFYQVKSDDSLLFSQKIYSNLLTWSQLQISSTESDIKKTAKGAEVTKGLAINGSQVDGAGSKVEGWV